MVRKDWLKFVALAFAMLFCIIFNSVPLRGLMPPGIALAEGNQTEGTYDVAIGINRGGPNGGEILGFQERPPTAEESSAIISTLANVYDGWASLDLDLYIGAWSIDAYQFLKNGTERDYTDLLNRRKKDFKKYSRVDAYWNIIDMTIIGNNAVVACHYRMTFYKKSGGNFTEDEDELYILELNPYGLWLIIENYDYLKY